MNQELVFEQDGKIYTNSLIVANEFSKDHFHVIRDIKSLIGPEYMKEFGVSNFGLSSYLNSQNKEQPMYVMTRMGFMKLVFGFTGEKADIIQMKFINMFEQMEEQLKNKSLAVVKPLTIREQAAMLIKLADAEDKVLLLESKITEDKPAVSLGNIVLDGYKYYTMEEVAKIVSSDKQTIGRNELFKILRDKKILMENNIPYQHNMKYFKVTVVVKNDYTFPTTRVKALGIAFIKDIVDNLLLPE